MAGTDDLKNMLMTFRISELQTLLGFAGRNKNGRKNELQTRALELLRLKSAPIQMKIRELFKSINMQPGEGAAKQHQYPSGNVHHHAQQGRAPMYPGYYPGKNHAPTGTMPNNLPVHPDVQLKPLPFYDHLSELLKPSTLMPVGTARIQEQSFVFYFTPAQANEIAFNRDVGSTKSEYHVQVQMRFCLLETSCEQDDFFPPGIIVKVNGKPCPLPAPIPSNKQGVEPKRPPRPVNLSTMVHISPTVANTILVSWAAEFGRGYVIVINLVRKLTSSHLLHRLKTRGVRHADYTTALIKEKLREDADSEIATTILRVSLLCPLGKMRMSIPCRPTTCSHLQCFDASLYLQMNERKSTWLCPVCDQPGCFADLVIDGYFQEALSNNRLPSGVNEIELHQDGSWSICTTEDVERTDCASPLPVKNRGGPPMLAATVEIVDDDVVPLDSSDSEDNKEDAKGKAVPPVITADVSTVDLTLSDDEDVTPKFATTSNGPAAVGGSSNGRKAPPPGNNTATEIISLDSPSPPSTPEPPTPVPSEPLDFLDNLDIYTEIPTPEPTTPVPSDPLDFLDPLDTDTEM